MATNKDNLRQSQKVLLSKHVSLKKLIYFSFLNCLKFRVPARFSCWSKTPAGCPSEFGFAGSMRTYTCAQSCCAGQEAPAVQSADWKRRRSRTTGNSCHVFSGAVRVERMVTTVLKRATTWHSWKVLTGRMTSGNLSSI